MDESESRSLERAGYSRDVMRITAEATEAFGDQGKALAWMRRPNVALLGKTPLEMIATEGGTALVRQSLGVIAHGGVA